MSGEMSNDEKRTVEAFINLVLHKAGLDPDNVASIQLNAGFEAVVTVYPTNASGAKVIDKESGEIKFRRVNVPIAWDNQKLIKKVPK
jgi:hypothetical protein